MPKSICTISGCGRRHNARGMCDTHYRRWRLGLPLHDPIRGKRPSGMTEAEAFRHFMPEAPPTQGCWPWQGLTDQHGYGLIGYDYGNVRAHRVAHEIFNGPIAPGLIICHHCDNPPCCNPQHLYAGTETDNSRDRVERGRTTRGRPGQRGQESPRSKLTNTQARQIREQYQRGVIRQQDLADMYGVDQTAISQIIRGVSYC